MSGKYTKGQQSKISEAKSRKSPVEDHGTSKVPAVNGGKKLGSPGGNKKFRC